MELLHSIWHDVRHGKNVGLYITVVFAILFALLNLMPAITVSQQYINSLLLAILALVVSTLLSTRSTLERLNEVRKGLTEAGVYDAYPELPRSYLNDAFRKAKTEIRILQTYIFGVNALPLGLIEAARLGVPVKVLLIDLQSPILQQRLSDLGFAGNLTRPQAAFDTIQTAVVKNRLVTANIEIRFYDAIPPFPLYVVDDLIMIGYFGHVHESTLTPHIEVHGRTSQIGVLAIDTFDRLWVNATPYIINQN